MASFLDVSDLTAFAPGIDSAKAQMMIDDATAMAVLAAPCLDTGADLTTNQLNAVRAILRGAVLRWNEAGTGAMASQSAGPYSTTVDTRQQRRAMFWPSEISQLQAICGGNEGSGAFSIDTVGTALMVHADICSINFGALYCSCGAILTGSFPLYESEW